MQEGRPDVARPAGAAVRSQLSAILSGPKVRRAARQLAGICVSAVPYERLRELPQSAQHHPKTFPSSRSSQYVPATIRDVAAHMAEAASRRHPFDHEGRSLQADALAAIAWLASFGRGTQATARVAREREAKMKLFRKVSRALQPLSQLVRAKGPEHIRAMVQPLHVALIAAVVLAVGAPDTNLALDLACGLTNVGDVPASGWWSPADSPATADISQLDHDAWHDRLEATVRWQAARPGAAAERVLLYEQTVQEVARGIMHGPFTRAQLDAAYGRGCWRAMRRFGVLQRDKLRCCDNARTSEHNDCVHRHEKVAGESADFPARVAGGFADVYGEPVPMASGTDDLKDAYRHAPTEQPQYSVVAQLAPSGEVEYFTMPGFNFGISSAVPQFNRMPELSVMCARRIFGVVACKFFDDFNVTETAWTAASGQRALRQQHAELGMPFAPAKAVDVSPRVIFLGVESDLSDVARDGVVRMRVRRDRVQRLVQTCQQVLQADVLPSSLASSICGRLQFATSWSFCKVGRAAMQPLFAASAHEGRLRSRLASGPSGVGTARGVVTVESVHARGFCARASDVCIRRPGPLANPFPIEGGDSRCAACDAFEALLSSDEAPSVIARRFGLASRPRSYAGGASERRRALRCLDERLESGESFRLVCACVHAGRRCHGRAIARLLNDTSRGAGYESGGRIAADAGEADMRLSAGARSSLLFFASVLPVMPPHEYEVRRLAAPPVLVWTDARWEPTLPAPAGVGFVVAFPRPGTALSTAPSLAALRDGYDLVHGSAAVPPSFMDGFVRRKQQIGQLELLAAIVPYLSLGARLTGVRCLHYVDNTSAVAALAKGYSGAPDSGRLVHAFHATALGLGCSTYFEYVRSEANVSDTPSRVDLSGQEWDCGVPGAGLVSRPVPALLPEARDWADRACEWVLRAARARSVAA